MKKNVYLFSKRLYFSKKAPHLRTKVAITLGKTIIVELIKCLFIKIGRASVDSESWSWTHHLCSCGVSFVLLMLPPYFPILTWSSIISGKYSLGLTLFFKKIVELRRKKVVRVVENIDNYKYIGILILWIYQRYINGYFR